MIKKYGFFFFSYVTKEKIFHFAYSWWSKPGLLSHSSVGILRKLGGSARAGAITLNLSVGLPVSLGRILAWSLYSPSNVVITFTLRRSEVREWSSSVSLKPIPRYPRSWLEERDVSSSILVTRKPFLHAEGGKVPRAAPLFGRQEVTLQ